MLKRTDWTNALPALGTIFRQYSRENFWLLISIGGEVLLDVVSTVATPYVFSRLIDQLVGNQLAAGLLLGFFAYAVLHGLGAVFSVAINYLSIIAAENLNFVAATQFFAKLLHKPGSFFIDNNPVQIQTARQQGQYSTYALVQLAIIVFLPAAGQIVLSLSLLGATINLELMLIVLVYGLFYIGLTFGANVWTRRYLDAAIEAQQENARFVGNAVNAMETLRYFNGDRWISARFAQKAQVQRRSWISWSWRRVLVGVVFGLGLTAQLALTYFLLLPRYDAGLLSVGDVVLINTILMALNRPFEGIGTAIDEVMRALSRFKPFADMWNAPEDKASFGGRQLAAGRGVLQFDGVGFRYGERQTLEGVNFSAQPGVVSFITGHTGSGKSTLFKLALKSLEPTRGRILVDGIDLATVDRQSWYDQVGVVPQDVMLLNDSLEANIVLGRAADPQRLREAAAQASILDFIDGLPEGFATTVGERGLKLSGGERQRVSIARALYGRPKVLFLDEASSALDERTEADIMGELRKLADTVTIMAITHRRSVIGPGDQVVQLKGGSAEPKAAPAIDEQ
jgi:ATP-binding cassette subfamily B protein